MTTTTESIDLSSVDPVHVLSRRECIKQSTDRVLKLLLSKPEGGIATLSEIENICHGPVRPRYIRDKARKLAQNSHGVLFEPAHGVALRRLPVDIAAPTVGASARRRMRSSLNSLKQKVQVIDYGALSTDEARSNYVAETVRLALREDLDNADEKRAQAIMTAAGTGQQPKALSGAEQVRNMMQAAKEMLYKVG